jgi:muconolactone delta-isomerase
MCRRAVTDLRGATGLAIIQAMVDGQRDPHKLAADRDPRLKATQKEIARQLHGNWQADGLLRLKQELQTCRFFQTLIAECDQELAKLLRAFPDRSDGVALGEDPRKGRRKKKKGEISAIRCAEVALSHERRRSSPNRRHRCDYGDDGGS